MGLDRFRAKCPRIGLSVTGNHVQSELRSMGGKISAHRVVPVLAEISLVGRYRLSGSRAYSQPGVAM
jgi:hypothetical protein